VFFKKKRFQVVVPGFRVFPHSMRESWAVNLKMAGVPFRWIVHREGRPETTARQIQPEGVVLLLNDHHLDDLTRHLCEEKRFGRGRDGSVWVGLATEKVVGSVFPRSEEKTRLCARLCHLVAHFDPMAAGVISSEGAIPLFCHQYVDTETFQPRRRFEQKIKGIFWAGKLRVGDFAEAYRDRLALFERIKDLPGFSWREATNPEKGIRHIVSEKDAYQGLLNLPSNCPGFTSNFFENLAMGACVLQHDVSGPHPEGLEPGVHYVAYDKSQPEALRELSTRFMSEPDRFQKMVELGQEACRRRHTLSVRAAEIFGAAVWQDILQGEISRIAAQQLCELTKKIRPSS
jgi:hypothetical protein